MTLVSLTMSILWLGRFLWILIIDGDIFLVEIITLVYFLAYLHC